MLLAEESFSNLYPVQAYEPGKLKINDRIYEHSVTLCFGHAPQEWAVNSISDLSFQLLEPIIKQRPEVILLGTGTKLIFPPHAILQQVVLSGIGIEVMDTAAACRTYNLLLAEGRKVAAAIIV